MQQQVADLWGVRAHADALRAKAGRDPFADWTRALLARQRDLLGEPIAGVPEGAEDVRRLLEAVRESALAYVLTDEAPFAQRALEGLQAVADSSVPWITSSHADMYPTAQADLFTAEITKTYVTALSWIAPTFDQETVERLVNVAAVRGGRPIYEGACQGAWWGTALNSNWTAVLNGGLLYAALTLRPFDAPTATAWLNYARSRLVEMLDLAAEEGAGVEGPGYWLYCFGSILDAAEALEQVLGDDLFSHPFWGRCSRFLPYLALPDFSAWTNYADTAYRGLGRSEFFHGVAARTGDGLAQWFGNRIMTEHDSMDWKNLLYYDASVEPCPVDSEPCCRFFSSIHLASFRSDWGPEAAFLMFKGGSNAWSHTHLDLNSFFLAAYGDRLAVDPGPAPYSIDYWHSIEPPVSTAWHNCIVVDGGHQRVAAQYGMSYDLEEAGDCYSRLDQYLDAATIAMIQGDASTAYGDTLARAGRDIVYLKPDVFIVFDDLVPHPVRCHRNVEWMLHSEFPLQEVAEGFEAVGDHSRLLIQPVFPRGWEAKTVAGRSISKGENKPLHALSVRPYWHHKWNVDPSREPYPDWDPRGNDEPLYPPNCRFLVVLTPLKNGASARFELAGFEVGSASGVTLQSAAETAVVIFNPDAELVDVDGVRTDAERVVLRRREEGLSWAVVLGSRLSWQGKSLLETSEAVSRTGECGD